MRFITIVLLLISLFVLASCSNEVTPTPKPTASYTYQNCFCYETDEITDVLVLSERGSNFTELYFQSGERLKIYDSFWAAGSYSWQGEPKQLDLKVGSSYHIKTRTKYSTSCEREGADCGSWKTPWDTEILEVNIVNETSQ